jgi:hypothetical protein
LNRKCDCSALFDRRVTADRHANLRKGQYRENPRRGRCEAGGAADAIGDLRVPLEPDAEESREQLKGFLAKTGKNERLITT